jgi:hypothetical protein
MPTGPTPAPNPFMGAGMRPGSGTVTVHYSMVKLPEQPMMPRLFDERVGYFSHSTMDFSRPEAKAVRRTFLARWRLEKKDPNAEMSEPVKPIIFYVDPATPPMLAPYVKSGIESWKAAFEAAGFRNAIIAKDAPTKEEDPDWAAEDARYSVIRWLPSTIENAMGPHISDPRTGEILEADILAVMWGYKPIAGAKTPDEEKATLDEWTKVQEKTPHLRFSTDGSNGSDYGENTEAVGDADAVAATALGLKNLERVAGYLLKATEEKGENWDQLERVYGRVLGQWSLEMGHVAAVIGSNETQQLHGGQAGVRFKAVPKERQQAAVQFLLANGLNVPKWALNPEVLRRIEPDGAVTRVKTAQTRVMGAMLSTSRMNRLVEQAAMDVKAYAPAEFLPDVRKGVFSEVYAGKAVIDTFRRNTQRVYLEAMGEKLNGRAPATDDARSLVRAELKTLSGDVTRAMAAVTDRATRAHLDDVKDQIAKMLDPKFVPPAPVTAIPTTGRRGVEQEDPWEMQCWPDYGIYGR